MWAARRSITDNGLTVCEYGAVEAITAMMKACGGEAIDVTVRKPGDVWVVLRVSRDPSGESRKVSNIRAS